MSDNDDFQLAVDRDPPAKPKKAVEPDGKARQMVLLAGMDCLPGQLDLFDTDGIE